MKRIASIFFYISLAVSSLSAQQWDGQTLYSTANATTAYLVDTNGTAVKTWSGLTGGTGYSTYLEPGGTLVRSVKVTNTTFNGGGACGRIQKVSYAGTVTWDYTYSSSTYYSHHDHCVMPNGNVLLICYESKTAAELAAAGGTASLSSIWPEKIVEIQPTGATTGTIVWEWHVWDHLVQNVDANKANYQTSIVNHPELLNINYQTTKDWMHMNGIDYNPILDQIVVSSHNLDEWYVIDHSTTTAQAASHSGGNSGKGGDFLYRWGNPAAYGASGTTILNVTHDAHWIPEGSPNAGYLVAVNNQGAAGPKTTIDQINPPRVGYNYTVNLGSQFLPATYDLRHTSTGYTSNMGSSEQFPNGNQMICLATAGTIYEINSAGTTLWTKSTGGNCAQAHRYTTCYINNAAPAIPTISLNGSDLFSTTAATYQWYYNGDIIVGATSQNYTPTADGVYVVRITDTNGCVYRYSAGYNYVSTVGVKETVLEKIKLYPNPTTGIIDIDFNYLNLDKVTVTVLDALGNNVFNAINVSRIDLSNFGNGVYFVRISSDNNKSVTHRVILAN